MRLPSSPSVPPVATPLIEIRGLAKTYADGTPALRGIDLDVGEGMFGLLGPNGAGKTTFLSILVLVQEPSAGSRRYEGLDAAAPQARPEIRRRIGYLPQDFRPLAHLTGEEYLAHCGALREMRLSRRELSQRIARLLAEVDLTHAAKRRAGTYSGGMCRRLGLAQALIHRPRFLIIDEPTAGLDPEERIRFRSLITEVAETTAVLLSTHIVEDIEATCPRIAILAQGALLFDGEPGLLMRQAAGRLFLAPAAVELPADALTLGRRVLPSGEPATLFFAERPPAGALPYEVTLEAAYSTFLARRGAAPEPAEEAK